MKNVVKNERKIFFSTIRKTWIMSKETVLILGAKSDIAMSTAHYFAKAGYDLQFAARKVNTLDQYKSTLLEEHNLWKALEDNDKLQL